MSPTEPFPCLMVRHSVGETTTVQVESITVADLPPGEVLIKVVYSSLNYKDALATQAHPGVVNQLPHVPGIDCAGTVVESSVADFAVDDSVLVTGYDLGAPAWGGFSRFVRVPSEWVVRLPAVLSPRQAMIYGTAGFTAAQSVRAICHHGILPTGGEVVVTGATGGVGSVAVALLAKLGYTVVAVTGKPELHGALTELGAARILSRQEVSDTTGKPLLSPRWAAAVDTVGGNVLATLLRSLKHRGCVTACGLVAGIELPPTVFPFILRGAALLGIDSAKCPRGPRLEIWNHLAGDWNVLRQLEPWVREVSLAEVPAEVTAMLAGKSQGRVLVRPMGA